MHMNFCSDGLISSLSCSSTCFEGNDVTNLIKTKGGLSGQGFLADHYVKPPVNIVLKFLCTIDISRILIKTFVGAQRSCNFELWTKSGVGRVKVCSTLDLSDVDFIVFHRFGEEAFPSHWKLPMDKLAVPFDNPLKLKNVREFELIIKKTSNSSVPCLGLLEVWGVPSKSVPRKCIQVINKRWASFFETPFIKEKEPPKAPPEPISRPVEENSDMVPEEFIDPITCEIMLCPMVLPSGKIVDQTTLAKFYDAEEKLGRGRSDPFTGLVFSDMRKPVLDSVLKAKIDKYLVANSDSDLIKNMPRIIGKKPNSAIPGLSVPYTLERHQPSSSAESIYSYSATRCSNRPSASSSLKKAKRTLDELISDSLDGLPSYLEAKVQKTVKDECSVCFKDVLLFKLPCSHIICRLCLLKYTNEMVAKCNQCQKSYVRSDPVRYHNS